MDKNNNPDLADFIAPSKKAKLSKRGAASITLIVTHTYNMTPKTILVYYNS